jgi:hypothetical protein
VYLGATVVAALTTKDRRESERDAELNFPEEGVNLRAEEGLRLATAAKFLGETVIEEAVK